MPRAAPQAAILALALALPAQPAVRLPWSFPPHRVIAELAWERLSPGTRARLAGFLEGRTPGAAATWPDSIRPLRPDAAPWHYVNIPLDAERYDAAAYCPAAGCVIEAIQRFRTILADSGRPAVERAEALRFLVHFVSDLHQPLHVADRGDRGGNGTAVELDGRRTNLHAVWDGDIVASLAPSEEALMDRLRKRLAATRPDTIAAWRRGSVVNWAMDGHRIVRERVYRLPEDGRIGRAYLAANQDVVETAMLQAAVRLAMILEAAVGTP